MKEATKDERRSWPAPLYPRLMGTAWAELDEAVRQAHMLDGRLRGVGMFRVQHGTGKLARFLLAVLPLPPAGETVATKLVSPFNPSNLYAGMSSWYLCLISSRDIEQRLRVSFSDKQ